MWTIFQYIARFLGGRLSGVDPTFYNSLFTSVDDEVAAFHLYTVGGYAHRVSEIYLRERGTASRFNILNTKTLYSFFLVGKLSKL